ncbi:MAG TPA: hypothetical protein VK698_39325 [Kofleriaceae bacterium]|nr:hypothetical protein [Kofleriaceae bacterium]
MPAETTTITLTPLTADEVFEGGAFRSDGGLDEGRWFFRGHLTAGQVDKVYFEAYPEQRFPDVLDADSVEQVWQVFTAHGDDCYLVGENNSDTPFTDTDCMLCTCESGPAMDHDGVEYRHPHKADATTPGAIAVTWATIRAV